MLTRAKALELHEVHGKDEIAHMYGITVKDVEIILRGEFDDEFEAYLVQELKNPVFRAGYEDAGVRAQLLDDLVKARQDADLSQIRVAERLDVSQQRISILEGGGCEPHLSTLQRYARAVNKKIVITLEDEQVHS
jgi:DNA-binding XRE family transcriptional regulator